MLGEGVEGEEVGGGEGEDIDLPNLPDQPDNPDVDQDDLPVNAGGKYVRVQDSSTLPFISI